MSDQPTPSRETMISQIIERAVSDPQFRQELLHGPARTLEQATGVPIPPGVEIRVVEETPSALYLVLPAQPGSAGPELSDQELEQVAGGGTTVSTFYCYDNAGCATAGMC